MPDTKKTDGGIAGSLEAVWRRPVGWAFTAMMAFGVFAYASDAAHTWPVMRDLPVFGVFIIPAAVGMVMLVMTRDEVSRIHGRFDVIDSKLDSMDKKLDVLEPMHRTLVATYELLDRRLPPYSPPPQSPSPSPSDDANNDDDSPVRQ